MVIKKLYIIIGLGVLSILAILLYFLFNPESGFLFPKCPVHKYMGIHCSGCGTQRAIHDLLHLRIGEAISHNALLLPAALVILQHALVELKWIKGPSLINYRYAPLVLLGIVILFMVLRNLPIYPFTYLAP